MVVATVSTAVAFFLTALLTYLFMKIGLRKGILDIPNARSSHTRPVPRGGGVAIVVTFLVFLAANSVYELAPIDSGATYALIVGGGIVAIIGAIDDLGHIRAMWRFLVHMGAAMTALALLPALPEISILGLEIKSEYLAFGILTIALVWFVNLFNFMDGIDGIASIEAITMLAGGAFILFVLNDTDWLVLLGIFGASVAGFLVWNWSPAKVFMGDACSGFLGLSLGILAIATSTGEAINLWSWMILAGVFVVDATTTLLIRMLRGQTWYSAHRMHAYQILSRRFNSHATVTVLVLSVNILWLLPLALVAALWPNWGFPLCVVALTPLAILAILSGAGRTESISV